MSEKNDRKSAKLGIFVLIGLVLFLVAVFFIGSEKDMFSSTFQLHARFNDVNGLQKGNNVRLSGVKIGTVRRVEIISDSLVGVTMRIREEDRKYITQDAVAYIGSDGLVGNMIVVIEPGRSGIPVEEDALIASGTQTSTQDILNTLETTGQNVLSITEEIQEITRQINSDEGTIGRLLNSPELANNLEGTVENLETTSQRTARLSGDLAQMVNKLQANEQGPVQTLLRDTTFATVYDSLLLNLRTSGQNVEEITRTLDRFSEKLNNQQNTLDVLLTDTTFANNLERTIINAAEGTENFNETMEALQSHWLLRGFFRRRNR